MSKINAVCVYCGSSTGSDPAFAQAAKALGKALAQNGVRLVYGGGSVGMMGTLARAVLENGGQVTGIIPEFLTGKERPKPLTDDMIVTRDMHERKRKMFEHADAFVALPGGIGTLEELVEQLTWAQIGQHKKPVLLANINGFWEPFRDAGRSHGQARLHLQRPQSRSADGRPRRGHSAEAARGGASRRRRRHRNGGAGREDVNTFRHSGSEQSEEPGIHSPGAGSMDSGFAG